MHRLALAPLVSGAPSKFSRTKGGMLGASFSVLSASYSKFTRYALLLIGRLGRPTVVPGLGPPLDIPLKIGRFSGPRGETSSLKNGGGGQREDVLGLVVSGATHLRFPGTLRGGGL